MTTKSYVITASFLTLRFNQARIENLQTEKAEILRNVLLSVV